MQILFYRPKEGLYERLRQDSVKQEGLEYTLNESLKYSRSYLEEYIDDGSMYEYETDDNVEIVEEDNEYKVRTDSGETRTLANFYDDFRKKWTEEMWERFWNYKL